MKRTHKQNPGAVKLFVQVSRSITLAAGIAVLGSGVAALYKGLPNFMLEDVSPRVGAVIDQVVQGIRRDPSYIASSGIEFEPYRPPNYTNLERVIFGVAGILLGSCAFKELER